MAPLERGLDRLGPSATFRAYPLVTRARETSVGSIPGQAGHWTMDDGSGEEAEEPWEHGMPLFLLSGEGNKLGSTARPFFSLLLLLYRLHLLARVMGEYKRRP